MKILHIVSALDRVCGGTAEVVPRMCEELAAAGHEVIILTLSWSKPGAAASRAEEHGVKIRYCRRSSSVMPSLGCSREFAAEVKKLLHWADVAHLHGLWQWPCWRAASEAIKAGRPYVMQTHGFLEPERLKRSTIRKAIIGRLIERPHLAAARRVIATAESEKEGLLKYRVKTPVEVVPIGIDTHDIEAATGDEALLQRLGVPSGKRVVLYLSRLAPIKGLDMLAEAWMRLAEFHDKWHLLIVGGDTQGFAETVRRQYAECVTDGSASLPGPVYGPDKFRLLKSADVFVLPTRSENFGIAVLEALAAGLPVVCTKGAPWGVIAREGAGRWVDIDSEAIERGLRNVMSCGRAELDAMGAAGRRIAYRDFSWPSVTKREPSGLVRRSTVTRGWFA